MPDFTYTAVTKSGEVQRGTMDAKTQDDVVFYVEKQGLYLVSIKEKKEVGKLLQFFTGRRLSLFDKYLLFQNLGIMLGSTLPLNDALQILQEDADKKIVKEILASVNVYFQQGRSLAESFSRFPDHFTPVVIDLIRSGEVSGTLEKTIKLVAIQYKKNYDLTKKIQAALIYPAILLATSIGVIILLLAVVVPRLTVVFSQVKNAQLPALTQAVLFLSDMLSNIFLDAIVFGAIGITFWFLVRRSGRETLDHVLFSFPVSRRLYQELIIHRFCWTMNAMIASGVGITQALDSVGGVISIPLYKEALKRIRENVEKGVSLGAAMREQKEFFPSIVTGMVFVGERTGSLDNILAILSDMYEERFDSELKSLVALLEPVLLLVMGLIVGLIALSVIMPIYQLVKYIR